MSSCGANRFSGQQQRCLTLPSGMKYGSMYLPPRSQTSTYIANKQMKDRDAVRDLLKRLLMVVSVAAVSEREIQNALNLAWGDFEDSVQYSVALLNEMDGIVTRNPSDYQEANMRIWLPEQALELFANEGS